MTVPALLLCGLVGSAAGDSNVAVPRAQDDTAAAFDEALAEARKLTDARKGKRALDALRDALDDHAG